MSRTKTSPILDPILVRNDENNIMLCVEEAGDAAGRPQFRRHALCGAQL